MEDDDAGLAAVRAFLATCSADALGSGTEEEVDKPQTELRQFMGPRSAKRRGYSTQLQRRKRAEMDALRDYARELEARLAALRHNQAARRQLLPSGAITGKSVALARLEAAAAGERRLRRRAEAANQQLRDELERCDALRAAIAQLIAKHQRRRPVAIDNDAVYPSASHFTSLEVPAFSSQEQRLEAMLRQWDGTMAGAVAPFKLEQERCFDLRSMISRLTEQHSGESSPFASRVILPLSDVEQRLEAMLKQVDEVFAWSPAHSTAPCWLETTRQGDGAEIRSSTASTCSVATAESLLWLTPGFSTGDEACSANMLSDAGDAYAKVFVMPLSCRPWVLQVGQKTAKVAVDVPLKVHHFARKVADAETGRLVIAMLAVLELPGAKSGGGAQIVQELAWTLVTPTGGDGTIVETCYRLSGGDQVESEGSGGDMERAMRTSVMRALVSITRRHRSMMQNWLLEAADDWC